VAVGDVIGLVRVELRGFPASGAARGADLRDALNERFEGLGVVEVGTGDAEGER
jgi:hypothetical protein